MRKLNALELTVLARRNDEIGESDPRKVLENFGELIDGMKKIKEKENDRKKV
jgi:hypothetical protein